MRTALIAALLVLPRAALADSRAQKYYYVDITRPFFELDPARPGVYRNQRPASKTGEFRAVKSTDTYRVFVIGGSIAGLLQYENGPGDLGPALRAALPSKKIEVLNCGMAGYESYREALVEQEILEYSPDLILFLTGHNEGVASAPIPVWVMRAQERLSRFAAFRALARTLHPEKAREAGQRVDLAQRDAAFERNLAENVRHARARGVQVALVVPPLNDREPADLDRGLYGAEFVPGWIRFLRGDYAGARRFWKESLEEGPGRAPASADHRAYVWGFIARAEEKLGRHDEARASFAEAARLNRAAVCGPDCHAIIRRVSAREGASLIEADRMFRELASPRLPGLETFNDRMHWKPRFNCLMSSEIIAALRAAPGSSALPWDESRVRALAASCERPGGPALEEDDRRMLSYALMELSWPDGGDHFSTTALFYLQAIRRHRPEWFGDVVALIRKTENPQTQVYGLVMAPESTIVPRFQWHLGEVLLLEKDYAGAEKDFALALENEPELHWARLSAAVAAALRGDKTRALALLRAATVRADAEMVAAAVAIGAELGLGGATAVAPSDPGQWLALAETSASRGDAMRALSRAEALLSGRDPDGQLRRRAALVYQRLKEYDLAVERLGELTRLFPKSAAYLSDKGLCEHLKGADDAALTDLKAAVDLDPRFLPATLNLGFLLTALGRPGEALAAYDQALARAAADDPLREVLAAARRDLRTK